MKKYLEIAIKYLIYATFFVPLLVLPQSFIFPFIVPKILMFRTLVEIMLGCYILLLIINWQEYRPKVTPVSIAVLLFFLSFAISTFVGVDPYHSFWDNHERMLGLLTISHFVIFYFICTAIFKDWKDWRRAFLFFLGAGSVVMFIGLLQIYNPELLLNRGSVRVSSTLGNSIYLSSYGMFLFFSSLLLFFKEQNKFFKYFEIAVAFLGILGLFAGGSRGPLLGCLVGIAFIFLLYAIFLKENKKVRNLLWVIIAFGLVLLSILYLNRTSNFVSNITILNRTLNTSLESVKNSPRWIAWGIAIDAWSEKPLFGWGPNNYFYAFNKYYSPRLLEFGYSETWFDNAHNIILNTLAVQGAFGILTYLALFIVAWIYLSNNYKNQKIDKHIFIIGSAFLFAHLVQNITVFENPTSYLYFMFWLAMISSVFERGGSEVISKQSANKNISSGSVIGMSIFILLLIFIFNIQPARANMKTLNAIRMLNQNLDEGLVQTKSALEFNSPHIDDIRSDLGRTIGTIMSNPNNKLPETKIAEMYNLIYPAMEKNITELHPLDIRNHMTMVQLDQTMAINEQDINYLVNAEKLVSDALSKSVERQQLIYTLAGIKAMMGKMDEAETLFKRTIELNPKIAEGYWRLAALYKNNGDIEAVKSMVNFLVAGSESGEIILTENDTAVMNNLLASFVSSSQSVAK